MSDLLFKSFEKQKFTDYPILRPNFTDLRKNFGTVLTWSLYMGKVNLNSMKKCEIARVINDVISSKSTTSRNM